MTIQKVTAKVSSVALRISALIFFRLFPAHFPGIALALFAVYVPSFFATYFTTPELEAIDEIKVAIKETTPLVKKNGTPKKVVAKKIDVKEKVTVRPKPASSLSILLFGAPNATRPFASILTFLVNLVFIGCTVDALYRARIYYPADDLSFVRLGYVSPNEATFLIREPDQAKLPLTFEIHVKESEASADNALWQPAGDVKLTSETTDFTAALTVSLTHSKQRRYEWRTSNNHTGEFLAPPKAGSMPDDGKFTFLSTSCILPRFPYNPLDHPLAIPGLRHLANKLPDLGAQFMLFLGDFIYVDVPQRFGKTVDEYRMQYRQVYASPDWAPVAQNLSWIHVLDDHEISNDWSSKDTGVYRAAVDPWHLYQANVNPPKAQAAGSKDARSNATWYEFVQGPASFFMMDTRSYRSSNDLPFDATEKTMLGPEQLADFLSWLARPEPAGVQWKVVASSIPFTKNWPVNVQDTWGGFLVERQKILEHMWDAGVQGTSVIILSGDRHEFAATKFPPPPDSRWPESAAAHEFSTSPLNQFASPFPTYKQTDDEDVMVKYIPGGISKFGSFTMEKVDGKNTLHYRLFIDGEEAWSTVVEAAPMPERPAVDPLAWGDSMLGNLKKFLGQ